MRNLHLLINTGAPDANQAKLFAVGKGEILEPQKRRTSLPGTSVKAKGF